MEENKLNWDNFAPLIDGSWWNDLKPFIESKECWDIYQQLKADSKEGNIYPKSDLTWRAFKETKKQDLKVVFLALCPYHTCYNGIPLADGLTFSAEFQTKQPPSLQLIWNAVEDDLCNGLDLNLKKTNSLKSWANDGVLLLNVGLTVKENKPESHSELWKPFMTYLFDEVFSKINGLLFVFFGKTAAKWENKTTPFIHYSKVLEHPAFSARQGRDFNHEYLFSWCNRLLKENNGDSFTINWLNEKIIKNIKESEVPF